MLIIAQVLKEKWLKITGFAHSQTTKKLVNKAANDSARVSGQDRKKLPVLGTNQIARFRGFRPPASLEKNKCIYYTDKILHFSGAPRARQRSLIAKKILSSIHPRNLVMTSAYDLPSVQTLEEGEGSHKSASWGRSML